ncbi:hypothetical protein [Paraflavitalea pollutisoli]|uniref:hypothetical protein n=1 Tax=Paraflavitalea pollutisoli TaxID=3034143 RepID=UPI0023EDAAD4|nr:hypothetical protein [Paraflavitalea sp. H1-2-19X]
MKYLKEHLVHAYNWSGPGAISFAGAPSRRRFDPDNGEQLLFIINCFYESIGLTAPEIGQQLERLINTQLPLEVMSEVTVFNWLKRAYMYQAADQ